MTYFSVAGAERTTTVRYVPLLTWGFGLLAAYGMVDIVRRMADGRLAVSAATLGGLALLLGFTLLLLYLGGELVIARFDRGGDRIAIRRYGLLGPRHVDRPLSDLARIEVRVLRKAQHRVELRMRSGELLPLTSYYIVTFNPRGLPRLSVQLGVPIELVEPTKQ